MYQVDRILNHRVKQGRTDYLVKWRGYSQKQATWEPEVHLATAKDALHQYYLSKRDKKGNDSFQQIDLDRDERDNRGNLWGDDANEDEVSERSERSSGSAGKKSDQSKKTQIRKQSQKKHIKSTTTNGNGNGYSSQSNHLASRPTPTPITTLRTHEKPDVNIKVLGMTEYPLVQGGPVSIIYKILEDGEIKWVTKNYFNPFHYKQLCDFYQEHLSIKY